MRNPFRVDCAFLLTQGWRQNTPPTLGSVMQPLRGRYFYKKYAALGVTPAFMPPRRRRSQALMRRRLFYVAAGFKNAQ
jgi:hypothetical protein